ncbi:hypothetical protein WA158_000675 [Blastocystis sp. Blastoise]
MTSPPNLDHVLERLWKGYRRSETWKSSISKDTIQYLISSSMEVIKNEPVLLRLKAPVTIVADLHGQFDDLLFYFKYCGIPPETNYLFLGDYVDRTKRGIEVLCLLMIYKIKYPGHIFLLRGNHEAPEINEVHGFKQECTMRFDEKTYQMFEVLFMYLPIAAIVGEKIFCVHGGISPSLTSLHQLNEIQRPYSIPAFGVITDLVWSDPNENISDWEAGKRMISYQYGQDAIAEFMSRFNLDLIVRAHEMVDGYQFMFNRKVVSLFSAPEYYKGTNNAGAAMLVSKELHISFMVLRPSSRRDEDRSASPHEQETEQN